MEARDMFLRISTLVMEQSDKIQKIEYFATQSTNKVEKGGTKLEKARGLKAKALKVRFIFIEISFKRYTKLLIFLKLISYYFFISEKDVHFNMVDCNFSSYNINFNSILA